MHRLLIVDDMPVIVDGLSELFADKTELQLEVFRAYSVFDALNILNSVKIDIVLSDVKMPVKTGIDLLKEIRAQWPRCKVIFLTSYHDFHIAREAVSYGLFDFIMKTEGDARIVEAVTRAIYAMQADLEASEMNERAKGQFQAAKPFLQKEYFMELLEGRRSTPETRKERFHQLDIPLIADAPVYLMLARLDEWKEAMSYSDRILLHYSVQNIMAEYMDSRMELLSFAYHRSQLIWFLQPKPSEAVSSDKELSRIFRFVYGTMETVQNTCLDLLKLKISFMICDQPVDWDEAPNTFQRLEQLLKSGIGLNNELLTTDTELQQNNERPNEAWLTEKTDGPKLRLNHFVRLTDYLNNGQKEEFHELFGKLNEAMKENEESTASKLEAYHYLSYIFMTYLNRWSILSDNHHSFETNLLIKYEDHAVWQVYEDYFRLLADRLFERRDSGQEEQSNHVVNKVQLYINSNLHDDLSLTRLGDHVHLNPSYLSRLYKQITGVGLSEYIMDLRIHTAKEMLHRDDLKIHEIAEAIGYQSGIAFTRFFKKMMNMTPQEYRDLNR